MAQTKRKRKHRGNQAGMVERPHHRAQKSGRAAPSTRTQAKQTAKERRASRLDREPTWQGAIQRAGIAAMVFVALVILLFKEKLPTAIALGLFTFVMYIPMSYYTDRLIYRRRQKVKAEGKAR